MIKRYLLIAVVILFSNITFSQTDRLNFKNDAILKLNSLIKDYSKSSLDRAFERKLVFDDTIKPSDKQLNIK